MTFWTSSSGSSAERMRIDMLGRVGIGTTSPSYQLHVSESSNAMPCRIHNTHASFGSSAPLINLFATRSATATYRFIDGYSGAGADQEFRIDGAGSGYCDGSWNGGGADYAEYFEWLDGNTSNEDRRGISVVLDNEKIRPAVEGESPIGVISARPAVVGDNDMEKWKQKHLRSDFGDYIFEDYSVTEWEEEVIDAPASTETKEIPESSEERAVTETLTRTYVDITGVEQIEEYESPVMEEVTETVIERQMVDGVDTEVEVQQVNQVPVMETIVTPASTETIEHPATYKTEKRSYHTDLIPVDVTAPNDATVLTEDADGSLFSRRKLNPDWNPDTAYISREDRQEWDTVGLMGKLRIIKGQPVDSRWIKMRDVSDTVEEWLVR